MSYHVFQYYLYKAQYSFDNTLGLLAIANDYYLINKIEV